jgi:hypothetical protein
MTITWARGPRLIAPDTLAVMMVQRGGAIIVIAPIFDRADPRQGTILGVDTDPAGVDPRQGTILA